MFGDNNGCGLRPQFQVKGCKCKVRALDAFIHKGSLSSRGCEMIPLKTVDIFRLLPMAKKNYVQME